MKRLATRFVPAGTVILLGSLALAACGSDDTSASAEAGGLETVRVAFTPGSGTLPVHLAEAEGVFEDNGLKPEYTEGLDLATYIGALDKQFDIVMTTPSIFLSAVEQLPLVAVAGGQINTADAPNSVLMTKDDSIQEIGDLKGKRVGVPTLTGASAVGLQYLAKEAGLGADDVELVVVPFPQHLDQLESGNIDAAVSAIPFFTPLEASGYRIVADTMFDATEAAGAESSATVFFVASEKFAEENSETVEAFRDSLAEGIDIVGSDDAAVKAAQEEWLGLPPELSDVAPIPAFSAELEPEQLDPWIVILNELGVTKSDLKAEDLIWSGE